MNFERHHPGWPSAVALVAAVLALPSQAAPLTLVEALRLAEDNAPSLAAEQAKLQAASSAAVPAGELPDPQLRLGVQNYPVGGPERWSIDRDFMTMQVVGVMQEVPNRAKRQARAEVAAAAVERAAAEGTVERFNVRQAVALAWIDRLAVERQQALFADFFRENRLLAAAVQAQIAGGRGPAGDAVRPRQEAARLAERQDELAAQEIRARAALRRWIGVAADQPPAGDWPEWSVDHAHYAHQLPRHPALAAFEPMTREAQAKVREAQAEKKSDWSWEFDYQRRGREFGDMVGVQVSFDLPLFPGSRQDPKIAARHAELAQLEAGREALLREHAQQLEEDLADYQRLQRATQRNRDSFVPLAREKVELSLASYRAGKGDLLDVIAARQELIEARLRQVELEAQRARTGARLHFAYGEARP